MADENKPNGETPDLAQQVEYLRGLAQIVADEGLSELEVEADGVKLTIKSAAATIIETPAPQHSGALPAYLPSTQAASVAAGAGAGAIAPAEEKLIPLVSPMVGVFYRSPLPTEPNFVEVGDRVERGQTIGLVEAMKVFNEIIAESGGIVAEIKAESAQLVETGQPLILLK